MTTPIRTFFGLLILFAGLYLFTVRGTYTSVDDVPRYNLTNAIVTKGSFEIPPSIMSSSSTVDGRRYSKYGIGMSLLLIPAYLKGRVVGRLVPESLVRAMHDPAIWMMSATNAIVGAWAVALLFLIARRIGYRDRTATAVALSAGLASMLWIYSQTSFEHVLVLVMLEIVVLVCLGEGAPRTWPAIAAGCAMGYIFLTRWGDGWIFLPGVAALFIVRVIKSTEGNRLSFKPVLAFGVPVALGIGLAMAYNYVRFYDPFELGYDDDNVSFHFLHRGLFGFLFSPAKSVFVFTPLLVLAVAGFGRLARRLGGGLRAAGWFWLLGAPLVVYSLFENWHGGWCFGPRYILPSVVLATIALGEWLEDPRWSKSLARPLSFAALFILGVYAQIICLGSDFNSYSNVAHSFRFMPDACPLLALAHGGFFQPGQNIWFIRLLGWPDMSPFVKTFILLPLIVLAGGVLLLRRDLAEIISGFRVRLSQPSRPLAIAILAVLAFTAAITLVHAAGAAWRARPVPEGSGLKASWFLNAEWRPPVTKTETHPRINFDFSRKNRPVPGDFSVRWAGMIEAKTSGTYVLGLDACGTTTLWLDDEPRIFHFGEPRGRRLVVVSVPLSRGPHPIRIDYALSPAWDSYEVNGRGYERPRHLPFGLTLRWKPPGAFALRPISPRALKPETPTIP